MKVVRLQSNNILRLTAVDITPDGNLITIGGKNGAGKSSVLNSIAMALGGASMAPEEPIRRGEVEAKITVNLGDMIVTRRFSRDRLHQDGCASLDGNICNCTPEYTETRSNLTITNKDGAKYPSPQSMLDKLLGRLTFDPLTFAHEDPKRQDETLRKLVNVDVTPIEQLRRKAYDGRASVRKVHDSQLAVAKTMPEYPDAPAEEISINEISAQMLKAEHLRRAALSAEQQRAVAEASLEEARTHVRETTERIAQLQKSLEAEKQMLLARQERSADLSTAYVVADNAFVAAKAAVPDVSEIQQRLSQIESTNARVRANAARQAAMARVQALADQIEEYDDDIAAAEEAKRVALEDAQSAMPVPGLGLSDNGVTFNGLPFKQASTSEQLRVSVAIGLALNPDLKILLIRNGNLLDDDNLKAVAEQAENADAQIWMEYVTAAADRVQVMIEDGRIAFSEK